MIKQMIGLFLLGLSLLMSVSTAVASDRADFSPACNAHELGEKSVILVMTDSGLQALQSVSDCESVLAAQLASPASPSEPTALQLVTVQTSPSPDRVTLSGLAFVLGLFITMLVLWGALLRPQGAWIRRK